MKINPTTLFGWTPEQWARVKFEHYYATLWDISATEGIAIQLIAWWQDTQRYSVPREMELAKHPTVHHTWVRNLLIAHARNSVKRYGLHTLSYFVGHAYFHLSMAEVMAETNNQAAHT